jgi:hypothetical protein
MRKVKFKMFTPAVYLDADGNEVKYGKHTTKKEGTGGYSEDFTHEGYFHEWAQMQDGQDADKVALVECADGTIAEVAPSKLKFEPYVEPYRKPQKKATYELMDDDSYRLQVFASINLFGNYNFERWPGFNLTESMQLQEEIARACLLFTIEPIIATNRTVLFMQRGSETILEYDGPINTWSIYGSPTPIPVGKAPRHIFEDYFNIL